LENASAETGLGIGLWEKGFRFARRERNQEKKRDGQRKPSIPIKTAGRGRTDVDQRKTNKRRDQERALEIIVRYRKRDFVSPIKP